MFPQSELDNYKLQVELLQEKLQRSEISRQQLEHKLDKILQKRDEHDKIVRSKTRQKYQQFLEEQQRRNERNKQLVQMLERIEQQTEIMNARSERLKMMKLQYEMYFAKLVHSQTRRCIQSSVNPVTQMMPTNAAAAPSLVQHLKPMEPSATMEGYNYVNTIEPPASVLLSNSYHRYAPTTLNNEKDPYMRSEMENRPMDTMTMPTLSNFSRPERNEGMDFRQLNVAPTIQPQQQLYQYPMKYEVLNNNMGNTNNIDFNKLEMPMITSSNTSSVVNSNISLSSVNNMLPQNKQFTEFKERSNLSSTISSAFEEIPNASMMPQMSQLSEIPNAKVDNIKTDDKINFSDPRIDSENFQRQEKQSQISNETNLAANNQILENNSKYIPQKANENIYIKQPITQTNHEDVVKAQDVVKPNIIENPSSSLQLEPTTAINEISQGSNNVINEPKPPLDQTNASFTSATQSNTSSTPVSIENIENAIYGELLSPLETDEAQKVENTNVVPKLLENLVTQAENIETNNMPFEETTVNEDNAPDNLVKDTSVAGVKEEQNQNIQSYNETMAYENYNNAQQPDESANNVADYNNYENAAIDESQQQQQYDYSNYDPSQYSYPGYIYDETTGEYKPDPNAPADQYATDQQYTAEGYDQQYQQEGVYDYNQTYAQDPAVNAENAAYENYDATQDNPPSNTVAESNAEPEQPITETEPTTSETSPEEAAEPSAKVTKPTSILSSAEKNDSQKKKKRVNFVESSETDESAAAPAKPNAANVGASSESDFDFSSSTEAEAKAT